MADQNKSDFDANKVLEDGMITGCVVRHLSDALEREEHEERVLNGPLSSVCTYPEVSPFFKPKILNEKSLNLTFFKLFIFQDYKERQSLYSCLTCQRETGEFAGVCFACSENCHEDHELIQLYTKRSFCCDCGNSKFKQKCKLFEVGIYSLKTLFTFDVLGENTSKSQKQVQSQFQKRILHLQFALSCS